MLILTCNHLEEKCINLQNVIINKVNPGGCACHSKGVQLLVSPNYNSFKTGSRVIGVFVWIRHLNCIHR